MGGVGEGKVSLRGRLLLRLEQTSFACDRKIKSALLRKKNGLTLAAASQR